MQAAMQRLIAVLRTENEALARNQVEDTARLLPEKEQATAALRAAIAADASGPRPDAETAAMLRALATENGERLSLAIEVQGRILELVARAARQCVPPPSQYGRCGKLAPSGAAQALALRA